ncbi:GNAT family N-acetyltransferase [Streptomyces sp. 5-8]|uniref:GNAT family N-acetyltransferase n=1 Tax=Streptomyces musisoli TaxID=2802280 RepID=A0ABS1P310_9ACTN|nr:MULTISPECIES: GNAT family N-acetyltransferase [Streptomyces]MBL1106316.1 GNAT family N-acetyltransferase [Streptomyces musisoli]MBY8844709.1 GNAT family N-acetyltransferase [Streptomyces sp. SP2-10]
MEIALRGVQDNDLPVFRRQMTDPEAVRMAAFAPADLGDPGAFAAYWGRLRDTTHVLRTVLADGTVAGNAAVYGVAGEREVTYWIDRAYWGRGVATAALRALLAEVPERPLYARAAADNAASLRVLEKCGFRETARAQGFANARGREIEEVVLILENRAGRESADRR